MTNKRNRGGQPLVIKSILNGVTSERIVIDRQLRSILERDGIDLHNIAALLIGEEEVWFSIDGEEKYDFKQVGDDIFELTQTAEDPPEMSGSVLIGTAFYRGDSLFVPEILPGTVCLNVVGLRLGDVVSTGISRLDDRWIIDFVSYAEDDWPRRAGAKFLLAPNLVELGPRPV